MGFTKMGFTWEQWLFIGLVAFMSFLSGIVLRGVIRDRIDDQKEADRKAKRKRRQRRDNERNLLGFFRNTVRQTYPNKFYAELETWGGFTGLIVKRDSTAPHPLMTLTVNLLAPEDKQIHLIFSGGKDYYYSSNRSWFDHIAKSIVVFLAQF